MTATVRPAARRLISGGISIRRHMGQWILRAILIALVIVCLFPILWVLSSSFKLREELYQATPSLLVRNPSLENYRFIVKELPEIPLMLRNATELCIIVVVGKLILSTLAAYPLARMDFPGREALFLIFILSIFIPRAGGLMATYELLNMLRLRNSIPGLALYWCGQLTTPLFIMRQTFLGIPREVEDAAYIDGASTLQVILRIAVPMSATGMVVVVLNEFVFHWGEYLTAYTMIDDSSKYPIGVGIALVRGWGTTFTSQMTATYGAESAGYLVCIAPVIIVFVLLQKWFIRGLTEGILKF
ncbi:MAG: carbohydrate ABC transporter permease [Chloroflexi bacterium]|nr:carbohydrate ABC transporter permease [Chloroflexota bacterium]